MNVTDYNVLSERTLSNEFFNDNNTIQHQLHGAIGIVTEVGEIVEALSKTPIDLVNLSEEIGDVLWYLAIFQRTMGWEIETNKETLLNQTFAGTEACKDYLIENSCNLLDIYKKAIFYGKFIEGLTVKLLCSNICYAVTALSDTTTFSIEQIRHNNINKLKIRFPDRFATDDAIIRDTNAERKELERNDKIS